MNNPDDFSESLETIFWVKIRKFFDADPGSGMEKIRIRDGKIRNIGDNLLLSNSNLINAINSSQYIILSHVRSRTVVQNDSGE